MGMTLVVSTGKFLQTSLWDSFIMTVMTTKTCGCSGALVWGIIIFFVFCITTVTPLSSRYSMKHLWERLISSVWTTTTTNHKKDRMKNYSTKSERSLSFSDILLPWWDDLAPPFALGNDLALDDENVYDEDYMDDDMMMDDPDFHERGSSVFQQPQQIHDGDEVEDDFPKWQRQSRGTLLLSSSMTKNMEDRVGSVSSSSSSTSSLQVTHFCFLIHGHRGMARDLAYLQEVMRYLAQRQQAKLRRQRYKALVLQSSSSRRQMSGPETTVETTTALSSSSSSDEEESDESSSATPPPSYIRRRHGRTCVEGRPQDLIIHSAVCNEGKTTDGVANGGDRLVEEMLSVIRHEMNQRNTSTTTTTSVGDNTNSNDSLPLQDITLSVVGNSLGGIYSRYAIAQLVNKCQKGMVHVAETDDDSDDDDDDEHRVHGCYILDGRYRLHLNIFCTTASPHLGLSGLTYVPLPRTAEIGVAHAMGLTGKDLFRLNHLMKDMATAPQFWVPLAQFRKRLAYANAYGTDFPVPTATAAFLSSESTYPHYFTDPTTTTTATTTSSSPPHQNKKKNLVVPNTINNNDVADEYERQWEAYERHEDMDDHDMKNEATGDKNDLIIAALHTPPSSIHKDTFLKEGVFSKTESNHTTSSINDDLLIMSNSLDSMGWKKVFVDIRREIPIAVSLPTKLLLKRSKSDATTTTTLSSSSSSSSSSNSDLTATNEQHLQQDEESSTIPSTASFAMRDSTSNDCPERRSLSSSSELIVPSTAASLQELRQRRCVESRDVAAAICSADDNTWNLPMGHNMIVAFSRNRISTLMNKGGRPVVDALAKELVEDIFSWSNHHPNAPNYDM